MKKKILITSHLCPGDILMLTAAVRDLYKAHSDKFAINVQTNCMELWDNNPYLDRSITKDNADQVVEADYPLINESNQRPYHFIHGYRKDLEKHLGVSIPQGPFECDLHLTDQEKNEPSMVDEILKIPNHPYWIVDAGFKSDYTCKGWEIARFQQVVDATRERITWVQIGAKEPSHFHPPLKDVIDLRGKTSMREIVKLMYHALGVLTPVSFPLHLAQMQIDPRYTLLHRYCICVAGGREPQTWESYNITKFLSNVGCLPCSQNGGCWKCRVEPLPDGDLKKNQSLCLLPVKTPSGQTIPLCMDMISVQDVVKAILDCLLGYNIIQTIKNGRKGETKNVGNILPLASGSVQCA